MASPDRFVLSTLRRSTDVIEDTANRARISYDSKYVRKVEELIVNSVSAILDEVAKEQPLFKVSELLKVGGFNEGTKILEPNEFDFLAVFEELSKPGAVDVELHPRRAGIARLKLNDRFNVDGKWDKMLSDGYVRCLQLDKESGNDAKNRKYEIFGREVVKAVMRLNRGKRRGGFGQFTEVVYSYTPREYQCNINELQQAVIQRAVARFPNILLEFTVANKEVNVDLCPAVRYHNVHDCFSPERCFSPTLAERVLSRGSILMVGQSDYDVRITFTETEIDYIRTEMLERHRLLYIYLKFVMSIVDTYHWKSFTSYSLKMICIRHDLQCRCPNRKLVECLKDVLYSLHEDVASWHLHSVFNSKINLVENLSLLEYRTLLGVIAYMKMLPRLSMSTSIVNYHEGDIHRLMSEAQTVFNPQAYGPGRTLFECEILYSRQQ